jgi:hypothetical protein
VDKQLLYPAGYNALMEKQVFAQGDLEKPHSYTGNAGLAHFDQRDQKEKIMDKVDKYQVELQCYADHFDMELEQR